MAQVRPSILYATLIIAAISIGVLMIYGLFSDSQKIEGDRYQNSYAQFDQVVLTAKQQRAIDTLKASGIEWAHFRFIEAIKANDMVRVHAFIDAGMALRSTSILLEIALSDSNNKKDMLSLLNQHYQLDLNGLYELPKYVSDFDEQLTKVSAPYLLEKQQKHEQAMRVYGREFSTWQQQKEQKKRQWLHDCTHDACRNGRVNEVEQLFASSEPKRPILNYVTKERVYLSLLTLFVWQNDQPLVTFIRQYATELIANKLFLTDAKLIYFTVDSKGRQVVVHPSQPINPDNNN